MIKVKIIAVKYAQACVDLYRHDQNKDFPCIADKQLHNVERAKIKGQINCLLDILEGVEDGATE
jgi:hypothetical protein